MVVNDSGNMRSSGRIEERSAPSGAVFVETVTRGTVVLGRDPRGSVLIVVGCVVDVVVSSGRVVGVSEIVDFVSATSRVDVGCGMVDVVVGSTLVVTTGLASTTGATTVVGAVDVAVGTNSG